MFLAFVLLRQVFGRKLVFVAFLGFYLLVVVNDGVHHVHHGFGGTEHRFYLVEPFIALEKVIGYLVPAAVVLHAQILHILPVARETRRTGLQSFKAKALWLVPAGHIGRRLETGGVRIAEILQELRILDAAKPLVCVAHDFVTTGCKDVRRQPIIATSHHTVTGFQMQVITAMQRFLTMSSDIGTKMVFIR